MKNKKIILLCVTLLIILVPATVWASTQGILETKPLILFIVGFIELFIASTWTKIVTKSQVGLSGIITFVNILLWYGVIYIILEDLKNWSLVIVYAIGCALGTMVAMYYFQKKEERETANQEEV